MNSKTTLQIEQCHGLYRAPAQGQILSRVLLYSGLTVISYLALLAEFRLTENPADYFTEFGPTELWQFGLLFATSGLLAAAVKYSQQDRPLNLLVLALVLCMAVREADAFFDVFVFDGAWQVVVTTILASAIFALRRDFAVIGRQLKDISDTSAFGFAVAAFVSLVLFSRLFGRKEFWMSLMGDDYVRIVKNAAEEGTETLGYTLLLIGVIDHLWRYRRIAKARPVDPD